MPAGGAPMDGADRAENRGNMRARRGSVLTSKNSIIGAVPGAVAGALILFLFPGGLPLRILAAGLALLVGYALGVIVTSHSRGLDDSIYILRLREELRASQNHLMENATFESLGAYLEIAAHQMKEPLDGVLQGVESLSGDAALPEGPRQAISALRKEAGVLHETLRHLAVYSMSKPGRAPFSVNTLVRQAILLCRHRAEEKRIRFEERYAVIPPVFGPAGRIGGALLNIIVNAVEAMPNEGGTIVIETAHEGDHVTATVRDGGIGIRPEHLGKIFDPFFTTKPEKSATGLGLWAARQSLDIIGADLRVKSSPHEGTEMTVVFKQAAPLRPGREGTTYPPELSENTAEENGRRIA